MEKKRFKENEVVVLMSNVQEIRNFIFGKVAKYDFSPCMKRPLSIKSYEGGRTVGSDWQDLYRLSGGMIKDGNGDYIDLFQVLVPGAAIRCASECASELGLAGPAPLQAEGAMPNDDTN